MKRLSFLLASLLAACSGAAPPNVILISIDTLRRDALACYAPGGPLAPELPALARFAAESVRYEDALSSASWTLPAHASLLTGLYPDRHGATDRRVTLSSAAGTLAEALARRGYETAAFTGGGFLDAQYGLGRGFARYEAKTHGKQEESETMAGLSERVRAFLATRRADKPLFLFLHTYAVHDYYDAPAEAVARAGRGELGRKAYVSCVLGRESCPQSSWDDLRALYRAELELMDASFATLRAELEQAGLWQDSIVLLLSDHGEGFDPARARIHHGGRLHADQLRVPLLVHGPGLAPRVEPARVSLVDVMPTLLELAGCDVPPGLDGRSFAANLRERSALAPRPLFAMEYYFGWKQGKRDTSADVLLLPRSLAVIDGSRWYITGEGADEVYEAGDAEQRRNVFSGPPQAAELRALLGPRPLPRTESAPAALDPHLDETLDHLGYGGKNE